MKLNRIVYMAHLSLHFVKIQPKINELYYNKIIIITVNCAGNLIKYWICIGETANLNGLNSCGHSGNTTSCFVKYIHMQHL